MIKSKFTLLVILLTIIICAPALAKEKDTTCTVGQVVVGVDAAGNIICAVGAVGPQGVQGKLGNTGAQGAQGKLGNTGAQGAQGKLGNTGAQGAQGKLGNTGAQGAQGKIGNDGSQGVQGKEGDPGSPGDNGLNGVLIGKGVGANTTRTNTPDGKIYRNRTTINPTAGKRLRMQTSYVTLPEISQSAEAAQPTSKHGNWSYQE